MNAQEAKTEEVVEEIFEWRLIDGRGRAMTNWKRCVLPEIHTLFDSKGSMNIEARPVHAVETQP